MVAFRKLEMDKPIWFVSMPNDSNQETNERCLRSIKYIIFFVLCAAILFIVTAVPMYFTLRAARLEDFTSTRSAVLRSDLLLGREAYLSSIGNNICDAHNIAFNRIQCFEQDSRVMDMDYHFSKRLIVWTDGRSVRISYNTSLPTNNPPPARMETAFMPNNYALAVDFVNDKIYVVNKEKALVFATEIYDAKRRSNALQLRLQKPKSIALDPYLGFMFITDGKRILRINMDGSRNQVIFDKFSDLYLGTVAFRKGWGDIAVDNVKKHIYAIDENSNEIVGFDYAGQKVLSGLAYGFTELTLRSLSFYNDTIYFVSDDRWNVFKANATLGKISAEKVFTDVKSMSNLLVVHSELQRPTWNPCLESKCEHMCLLTYKIGLSYSCACYTGWRLNADKRSCTLNREFFLYVDGARIKRRTLGGEEIFIPTSDGSDIGPVSGLNSVTFDSHAGHIFYTSTAYGINVFQRENITNDDFSEYMTQTMNDGKLRISLDWFTKKIYYIDVTDKKVNVLRYGDHTVWRNLVNNCTDLDDIAVDPTNGYVFFSQSNPGRISRVHMNGGHPVTFQKLKIGRATSLTIDFMSQRLFWLDAEQGKIRYTDFDGKRLKTLNVQTPKITNKSLFTMYKDKYYFYDGERKRVWNVKKNAMKFLFRAADEIRDLKVYGDESQPMSRQSISHNPCTINNGGCPFLCFAVPSQRNIGAFDKLCI